MKTKIILALFLIVLAIGGLTISQWKSIETPNNEINTARKTLSNAELILANKYAKADYTRAVQYYDSAMVEWKLENEKWFLSRNYEHIALLAQAYGSFWELSAPLACFHLRRLHLRRTQCRCQRFTFVNRTTPSWLPTALVLAVAIVPHGLMTSSKAEATLSRRLRTLSAPFARRFI